VSGTNKFVFRLSNTTKSLDQLTHDSHAILLENALIDSSQPLNLSIPKNLQLQGDPGAYIVQARGPIDNAFRAMLASAGAEIVSYIPNDAYLVRAPAGVANGLAGNPLTQAVIPFEPYYKISSSMPVTVGQKTLSSAPTKTNRAAGPSLLTLAVKQSPLPAGTYLTLGLFKTGAAATVAQIEKLGGRIIARDNSPFGPVVRVQPPADWVALAALPGVQIVEPCRQRVRANDLSRATTGVAVNTLVATNYMNLNGKNVMVEVNDFGIDATHPDFTAGGTRPTRIFGALLTDTDGHGTHVAGIIGGDGTESLTVTNAQGSIMPATSGQFRGMATNVTLLSMDMNLSDQELQEAAALTNALISNNSWNYGDSSYDLAAASYDAAVRDALPEMTGSQPVLFVFSAGNEGNGDDTTDPGNGTPDSILSPATAKNVITVGAIQEFRDITNQVMTISSDGTTTNYGTPWQPETSTSYRIAGFSSRGNVGIGTEGTYGRFKPDVVAPGTFVISTRSSQWDIATYFYENPTNYDVKDLSVTLQSGTLGEGQFSSVPANAVQVAIQLFPNARSPEPFPYLPIYFGLVGSSTYPYSTMNNQVSIPPDGGLTIANILNTETYYGFNYAVSNSTSEPIDFDIFLTTVTTNNPGNYFLVLSNLNQSIGTLNPSSTGPGPYYRYETGTSMAAADVSGVLALMQDYFTNQLHSTPSPALLKALLINGARTTGRYYDLQVQNAINYEGWGLVNLPNSLPLGVTNQLTAACASFFVDQSPANALATGDGHTYSITMATNTVGLRVTLAWTDPPGNPAAAIKLVNSLELVITNLDDPANPIVFYGNDIAGGYTYNTPESPTNAPIDSINNVQNVFIPPPLGTKYSVIVIGQSVNVNAVTAQTNNAAGQYAPNVVQDYALVISSGNSGVNNAFTVTDSGIVSNPTSDQQITYVVSPDAPYENQLAGASTPLLGTNTVPIGTISVLDTNYNPVAIVPGFAANAIVTLGMTNQWHFYVMTNPGPVHFTNAAFITFDPDTLSIPRMGVFADSEDATRPEADIDLYVSTDPTLMNLNPAAISNCVHGTQIGLSATGVFNGASLGRGGKEFVVDIGSAPGEVYYVGVYSEDQEASQYGFIPIFTDVPFSQMNSNGTQIVNGLVLPVNIPDGSLAHPGLAYVFALAIFPMEIQRVVPTTIIPHQHFGDLIGGLKHGGMNGLSQSVVLNNHDSLYNDLGIYTNVYDDSGQNNIAGSQPSDGPGSLNNYVGQSAIGPWILTEADTSLTQTGAVTGFQMLIEPHQNLGKGVYGTVGPMGWWYGYIDVPSGTASLTILATNLTQTPSLTPPLELYVNSNGIPTLTGTNEFGPTGLTNGTPPGNSIYIGSPPPGRYWVGLYNGSVQQQNFYLIANLGLVTPPAQVIFSSASPVPILDDAVTTDNIYVTADQAISSVDVGLRVDHPRVSDLVFHLISPDGTRVLLVENRGGATANMGATIAVKNIVPVSSSGGARASIGIINVAMDTGTLAIYYNFYSLPDEMAVYDQGNNLIFDSGMISGSGVFNVAYVNSSYLTIKMNPNGNSGGPGDLWDYTVSALQARQTYLVLTEDTNKTTTPIKFAPPPFVPAIPAMTINPPEWHSSFEGLPDTRMLTGSTFGGWTVTNGDIEVLGPATGPGANADEGTNFIDLDGFDPGAISTSVSTVPGNYYTFSFTYSQNPDGKHSGFPTAQVAVTQNGNPLVNLSLTKNDPGWANLTWSTTSVVFQATSPTTTFAFQSLDGSGSAYGVLLDCIDLTSANLNDGFENTYAGDYVAGVNPGFGGWTVNTNQVTVITDTNLAKSGSNLLALADGQISRILSTIPGQTYTLSFAYRGPGIVSLWSGESNAVDSVGSNNGTLTNGVTFANGIVGQAFALDGTNGYVNIPDSPSLDSLTQSITVETWMKAGQVTPNADWKGLVTKGNNSWRMQPTTFAENVTWAADGTSNPYLTGIRNVNDGQWHHVVDVYDGVNLLQYVDGTLDASQAATGLIAQNNEPVCIGANSGAWVPGIGVHLGYFFNGLQDEVSIYSRALSASEIKAIYNQGTNHMAKYETNAPAGIASGLAEAQVKLNGTNQPIFFGNNTNWQTITYSFIATTTTTPLQITGLEPGMLLDNFVTTTIPTNNYDLYYQPEESLDLLDGENAEGQWTLEIQDDRAGAGLTNTLVSWQLRFNFPYTPPTITTLTNGQVINSSNLPPGGIAYYLVLVPTNADISTNILLNTTGPLNLLFDAFTPPTGILPTDYLILSSLIPGGSAILTLYSTPNFAQGGTYYLGVQNLNGYSVNYDIQVFFHLVPPPLSLPQLPELIAYTNQLFTVTNAATGGVPPLTYAPLTSTVPGANVPVIDAYGAITWTPDGSQAPAVYTLTNIVNDSSSPVQWATNIFHVLVVLTNGQPAFPGAEGAGGFAIGGRGGDVYHVVNLNDSGPGSLRNGIISTFGSRTIVFDVSGTINLYSPLQINNPYFTIAGQTAPGAGITIQGLTFSAETAPGAGDHAHDEILRFLRCRPGDIYAQYFQGDSFHFLGVTNSIADHLSASWSLDTVLSTMFSTNVTVQWSMIAEPLDHSAYPGGAGFQEHGYGSLIRYGSGAISYLHNLYADNYSCNPRVGDNIQLDFINNVVCNWGAAAGLNGDDATNNPGGYTNYLNYRGNYFIAGSNSANPSIAFDSGVPNPTFTQIYEATNLIDTNAFNIVLDGTNTDWGMFSGNLTQLGSPTPMTNGIPVATNDPAFAYEQVLAFAGASVAGVTAAGSPAAGTSLLRDPVDTNIVANVRNKSGQIIDFISSNSFAGGYLSTNFGVTWSGYSNAAAYWVSQGLTNFVGVNPWPVLASAPQPLDSDGDGLPDYWEITLAATGEASMNPAVPNNNHMNPDGYTDLEHYLNWLAAPHALTVSNTPVDVDLYAVVGLTGNLSFGVTNGTNGTVTLGMDGHTAMFMPMSTNIGFASFGFTVTNLATTNGFGPVTVSVMISVTNIVTSSLPLTNAVPQTNTVPAGGIVYYLIDVPANAQLATNILLFAGSPVNLLFSRAGFPTGTSTGDYFLLTNSMGGISLLGTATNFIPTNIVAGGTYYLGVQNLSGAPVSFALEVDFYPPPSVPAGGVIYLPVTVPANADYATNILLYATGPLNIWFTTNSPPSITNANDVRLLPDAAYPSGTNGSVVLSAGTTPPLVPGSTYYLGVQNTNSFTVFLALEVNFHLMSGAITNPITGLTITSTNIGGANGFLLTWYAPTNDSFMVQWTGNLAPAVWNMFTNVITYTGPVTPTNGLFTFFDDGSQFPFGPMRFYRLILLGSVPDLTNGVPQTNSVSPGGTAFLLINVPASATSANNTLISATGPVNVFFNQTHLPTDNTNAGDFLELAAATTGSFLLNGSSVPPLVPGASYYLAVQNPGTNNVTFDFQVTFGFATPSVVSNFSITATNIGIWLKWNGQTNYQYQVQWTTNLAPPAAWHTVSNIVLTSTTGAFTFFDDGSLTGGFGPVKFYRLIAWPFMTPIPQTLSIASVTVTSIGGTNDLVLRWSAPTNYHYGIRWTTNLTLPFSNWFVIASPVLTLTNGVYTFTDNGQTGPPTTAKFFRLYDY
jgi:subtilisin-like proprotein convertase family protein